MYVYYLLQNLPYNFARISLPLVALLLGDLGSTDHEDKRKTKKEDVRWR